MTRAVLTIACLFLLGTSMALADDTLWTRRLNGQANRDDNGLFVFVDQEDNVISVGTVYGVGSGIDVGVVKYDTAGTEKWSVSIVGAGMSNDVPKGAALDASGNIYITAQTGIFPDYNIMTVKLPPTGSPETWRRTWAGDDGKADAPAGIVVDDAGDAYVTGYTTYTNDLTDWVTMKNLSGIGLPVWTVIRDGGGGGVDYPAAIALGPGNTVYVTGSGQRQYKEDYVTVKYNTAGVEQWYSSYNYQGNDADMASAIAVDDAGDAYVTGKSATAPAPAGFDQYATIKYANDTGAQLWVTRYTGTGGSNKAVAIALGDEAVYVTGSSQGSAGDYDYATIAYDKSGGSQLWATRFNGPPGKDDNAVGIAVLPYGMILVTGTSIDWGNKGDFMTLRNTNVGVQEWASRYNGPFNNDDQAASIAFDSHCNPVVLGSSYGEENYDFLTVKYDSGAIGGIAELDRAVLGRPGMRLAPNPARNWTSVQHSLSGAAPAIISLLGVDGRMIRTQRFDGQTGVPARLDLRGLAPGVYVVRLASGGRSATQKLVVEQ